MPTKVDGAFAFGIVPHSTHLPKYWVCGIHNLRIHRSRGRLGPTLIPDPLPGADVLTAAPLHRAARVVHVTALSGLYLFERLKSPSFYVYAASGSPPHSLLLSRRVPEAQISL